MAKNSLGCLSTLFFGLLALIPGSGYLAIVVIFILIGVAACGGWVKFIIFFVFMAAGEMLRLHIVEKEKEKKAKKEQEKKEREKKMIEEYLKEKGKL